MFTLQTRKSIFQVMQSLDDGLTRPASSTSPTLGGIFTSKSTYSNVRIFYVLLPSLTLTQYGDGDQYFYQDTISRWLPTRAKEQFFCLWDKTTPCQTDWSIPTTLVQKDTFSHVLVPPLALYLTSKFLLIIESFQQRQYLLIEHQNLWRVQRCLCFR